LAAAVLLLMATALRTGAAPAVPAGGLAPAPAAAPPPAPPLPPPPATISNVLRPAHTPDPDVIWHDGWYYSARSKIEATADNRDPPGVACWDCAQDQVRITRARRLQDIYLRPDADVAVIDRRSPFGGGAGGVSVGAYGVAAGEPCPSAGFWAPALKHLDGRWVLFVTGHRPDIPGESNFVLESTSQDPLDVAAWVYRGTLNHWMPGLDGEPVVLPTSDPLATTVTLRDNGKTIVGQLYFAYSHNNAQQGGTQQLHLVRLVDDSSAFSERDADLGRNVSYVRRWAADAEAPIAAPLWDWESVAGGGMGFRVNEGPTALYGPTRTFLMFSASFCATPFYALGLLEFVGEGDGFPFLWAKHPRPAFSGDVLGGRDGALVGHRDDAFGVGHNSFTVSPDLSEPWIVYHAKTSPQEGAGDREARAQRFAWRADGRPDFLGGPAAGGTQVAAPSEAEAYAVVCSEPAFRGRFCVGLPAPGRYDAAALGARGVDPGGVASVRLLGGASVALRPAGGGAEWFTSEDATELPEAIAGGVAEVEVLAAPPAAVLVAGAGVGAGRGGDAAVAAT
jgi:GH43 family beta-xylosidase